MLFLFTLPSSAQDEGAPTRPKYVASTTLHWNMDYANFEMDTWKAVEQEYFDKVTSKNDLIMGAGFYTHRYTPDNRELISVSTFHSWENIQKSNERTTELIEEGWSDEDARKAILKSGMPIMQIFTPMKSIQPCLTPNPMLEILPRSF